MNAPKSTDKKRKRAIDVLARTIWGEARGECIRGQEAVAAVVMNRVARAKKWRGYWWGSDVTAVCRHRLQFSCWNADDPNREKLEAVTDEDPVFASCLRIARRAVAGTLKDPTKGATHYHAKSAQPVWARGRAACATIGNHAFYNNVE